MARGKRDHPRHTGGQAELIAYDLPQQSKRSQKIVFAGELSLTVYVPNGTKRLSKVG